MYCRRHRKQISNLIGNLILMSRRILVSVNTKMILRRDFCHSLLPHAYHVFSIFLAPHNTQWRKSLSFPILLLPLRSASRISGKVSPLSLSPSICLLLPIYLFLSLSLSSFLPHRHVSDSTSPLHILLFRSLSFSFP